MFVGGMSREAMDDADLDVRRMRRDEILRRLRIAVESMQKVCRICNRSATVGQQWPPMNVGTDMKRSWRTALTA